MLSTPGVGSGLDINGIINQLMTLERRPLVQLGTEQIALEAQLSGFGTLKNAVSVFRSAMDGLTDADKFKFNKATTSDDEVLTASAQAGAAKGNYAIQVQRLAENHRLAAATVFADTSTTTIGTAGDTMTISVGTTSFTVAIGGKTLDQIRDAVNTAGDNAGVTASTLQDDAGFHLTLAAEETGSTHAVSVAYSAATDPFALQTLNADRNGSGGFTAADLDAVMVIENSFTVTRTKNIVDDVIASVSLNLVDAGSVSLSVQRDNAKITGSVQQFIGVYNELKKTTTDLRTKVLAEERGSLLNLEAQFRAILSSAGGTSTEFSRLAEIGVITKLDGSLELKTTVFEAALNADPAGMADLFSNPSNGLAVRLDALASGLLEAGGMLDSREQGLKARIDDTRDARTNLEFRLGRKEAALVDQFSALDSLLAQLNATSNYLATQLTILTPSRS